MEIAKIERWLCTEKIEEGHESANLVMTAAGPNLGMVERAWCATSVVSQETVRLGRQGRRGKNSTVAVAQDMIYLRDILTVSNDDAHSQDEWIFNSGSTYHVCSRRKYFRCVPGNQNEFGFHA